MAIALIKELYEFELQNESMASILLYHCKNKHELDWECVGWKNYCSWKKELIAVVQYSRYDNYI